MISLSDFIEDLPWQGKPLPSIKVPENSIHGVTITPLQHNRDPRGSLVVLKNATTDGDPDPIVFVYRVTAEPGAIRAWVFHKRQDDRLAFTDGQFRIVLYDLRPDSPTFGQINVIDAGQDNPLRLRIPIHVVHGVQNRGARASFVNMPTRAYDPANPDKSRVDYPDPRIPYQFD